MDIFRIFHLQCARRLPALPDTHPCSHLHGHSFRVELTVSGDIDPGLGWVLDFPDIEAAWRPIHAALDHRYVNDIAGLDNPTSENLAVWLWQQLQPALRGLSAHPWGAGLLVLTSRLDRTGVHTFLHLLWYENRCLSARRFHRHSVGFSSSTFNNPGIHHIHPKNTPHVQNGGPVAL